MKVVYLLDQLDIGGAERSLLEILSRFKNTVPVVVHLYQADALRPQFVRAGITVTSLNVHGKYPFVSSFRRFVKVLRQEKPDLIHVCGFLSMFVARAAARWLGIPLVDTFNNLGYSDEAFRILKFSSRCKLRLGQSLDSLMSGWISHVIAVSETVRHANAEAIGLSLDKVSLIYRGRDPRMFAETQKEKVDELRRTLGLEAGAPVILNVGRLIATKGHEELVRAFQTVRLQLPSARLLIAGDGYHRPVVEALIGELRCEDSVRLVGTRNDVPVLLQLADVFAFPSWSEGLSGALVEAMFAARPIIAFDCPANCETITNGETGLLVHRGSEELAEGMLHLLRNREHAQRMATQAREDAMRRFHIDHIAWQHEQVYEQVIRNFHPHPAVSPGLPFAN